MDRARIIMHVDLDAFFAAVEEREDPKLTGKPVVVGADPKGGKGRGVVSTCNYAARKYGIHSAMPISRAWKLCPEPTCAYVRPHFDLYVAASEKVMQILAKYADKFEQWGIDEAFLEVSEKAGGDIEKAEKLAAEIQADVKADQKLSCSIGIGPNKLIAKIASDFKKPEGLTVVKTDVRAFLAPLPVGKIPGIGPKSEAALSKLGVTKVSQLQVYDPGELVELFGSFGHYFHRAANGIDESEVGGEWERKSIGHEWTFDKDVAERDKILAATDQLAKEVHARVFEEKALFRTVTIKLRFAGFETHTMAKTLKTPSDSYEELERTARKLVEDGLDKKPGSKVRLVGVRVTGLLAAGKQKKLGEFTP